jgi:outer membrane lipoprotein-sorting protein
MLRRIMIALTIPALLCSIASAQTVDELIAKNNKARGGLEKVRAVKTLKLTGKVFMQGMEAPAVMSFKRPHMVRTEFTFQGMTAVQGYDGTTAWMVMPFMGKTDPEKMTAEDSKDIEEQSDADGPLVDYKEKGHKVELIGKEDMEGTPVYKIRVTLKNGDIRDIFLDGERYLEVKESSKRKSQGAEIELDTYFSDFKAVDGLMIPHAIESKVKDQSVSQVTISKVDLNVDLPDSLFKMPAKVAGTKADSTSKSPAKAAAGKASPSSQTPAKPPVQTGTEADSAKK